MPYGDRYFGPRYFGNRFFGPGGSGLSAPTLTEVGTGTTARTTTAGNSLVIAVPTGVQDGDRLILQVQTRVVATAGLIAGVSAFTPLQAVDSSNAGQHRVYTRLASSEPASYTITIPGTASAIAATMTAWRASSGYSVTVESSTIEDDTSLDTTINSAGITTVAASTQVITCFAVSDGASPTRIPLTLHANHTKLAETNTTTTAQGMGVCQAGEARSSAGATGARNATTAGGNTRSNAVMIALALLSLTGGGLLLQSPRD